MHFTKYTGLGNDFIFLDGQTALSVKDPFTLAKKMCDRRFGIGADGLILLLPSQQADVRMRIINSDGSEAEMCGNASRCVPLHLRRSGQTQKKAILLETLAGIIGTEVIDEKKGLVCVNMGTPRFLCGQIPMTGEADKPARNVTLNVSGQNFTGTGVSMGNPHFVIVVPDISKIDLEALGPQIENAPQFPQKTNVEYVQILSANSVRMRVWERGAGITKACGTGACATAAACLQDGKVSGKVQVILDGGTLEIAWPQQQAIFMTGPAQYVFQGDFNNDIL